VAPLASVQNPIKIRLGTAEIAQCLKQHHDKLSAACKTEFADLLEKQ
jgi:hypothetical protein